jgi:hypothetical protein
VKYTLEQKTTILRAYRERISWRGLQRVFGVWRSTVLQPFHFKRCFTRKTLALF